MNKTPGQVAFEAYNAYGPNAGKTYDGKPIPPWGELAPHTRDRWEAAALAVERARLDRFGNASPQIESAFARAMGRYDATCMTHNAPLSIRVLLELFEQELSKETPSIGVTHPPPPPPPPPAAPEGA